MKKKTPLLTEENDELLDLVELTAGLKVKSGWVYQKIHSGTLPFPYLKVGHYLRFPASGVREYLASQLRPGVRA